MPTMFFHWYASKTMDYNLAPDNLPEPQDDGAADHLKGLRLPSVALKSTHGQRVDVGQSLGWLVIYCYPMTGVPGVPLPPNWDQILAHAVAHRKPMLTKQFIHNCTLGRCLFLA